MLMESCCSLHVDSGTELSPHSVPHPRPERILPWGRVMSAETDTRWQPGVALKYGLTQ